LARAGENFVSASTQRSSYSDASLSWENQFLHWFMGQNMPMAESQRQQGQFSYYRFSTQFKSHDGHKINSYGFSHHRQLAAVKAAAEAVERKTMLNYFRILAPDMPPKAFHTSNGWAVHQTREKAIAAAFSEALERHLILKSYIKHGWQGFQLVDKIETPEIKIYFLVTRIKAGSRAAGIVATVSPLYPGVSFGYCIGHKVQTQTTEFWEPALHESLDKILSLNGRQLHPTDGTEPWIMTKIKNDLMNPFVCGAFEENLDAEIIEDYMPEYNIRIFDLAEKENLSFPLFCAFAWGKDLIPLFHKSALDENARKYLSDILKKNLILTDLPDWHPVA